MIDLRSYQKELIENIRTKFKKGKKRVILCAPTGAEKTVMFSSIVIKTISNELCRKKRHRKCMGRIKTIKKRLILILHITVFCYIN
jgi:type I site-specific restriction endonuclease